MSDLIFLVLFIYFFSLTERKKQWELERERQLKAIEEASIPTGHTLLPDEERLETLELLKKSNILNNINYYIKNSLKKLVFCVIF